MAGFGSSLPSVMSHAFSRIPAPQIQRSVFDRPMAWKGTVDAGYLVPILCQEILPGDTMSLSTTIFARLSTLIFPLMDNLFIDTFFFFVPNRLVWDNWERFNGAQDDPNDSTDFEIPTLGEVEPGAGIEFAIGSLADAFGLPTGVTILQEDAPSALPFRMYNLIWNTWFRDQNLQNSLPVMTDDGPDEPADADYALQRRGKRHDYFTSCTPEPQKGDSVALPLGTTAPVIGNGETIGFTNGTDAFGLYTSNGTNTIAGATGNYGVPTGTNRTVVATLAGDKTVGLTPDPTQSGMITDLSTATSATINQLREAIAVQQILERDMRGGTRYVELIKAHFGVTVPDFRLQRPEYLGGNSQRFNVHAVPQTAPTPASPTVNDVQGGLAAYGQGGSKSGFNKSFVEHGYVIGLVNVRADIGYQEGLERHWSRRTRYDFYNPALAHLGEQAVLNKEIYYADNGVAANTVFGYQERWAEMRYGRSQVTGLFRSAASGNLDAFHLALDFAAQPALNASFIVDNPPMARVLAVTNQPHVLMDVYHSCRHARPMPVYSVPGLTRF